MSPPYKKAEWTIFSATAFKLHLDYVSFSLFLIVYQPLKII